MEKPGIAQEIEYYEMKKCIDLTLTGELIMKTQILTDPTINHKGQNCVSSFMMI